jgi:hypothetical protein
MVLIVVLALTALVASTPAVRRLIPGESVLAIGAGVVIAVALFQLDRLG